MDTGASKWGINFKPDLTFGNIVAIFTVMTSAYGSFYAIQNAIHESAEDRKAIHVQIDNIQSDRKETKEAFIKAQNALKDNDTIQNNRMENFADRLTQLLNITIEQGKQIAEQTRVQAQLHEDLMITKYALRRNGQELPTGMEDRKETR